MPSSIVWSSVFNQFHPLGQLFVHLSRSPTRELIARSSQTGEKVESTAIPLFFAFVFVNLLFRCLFAAYSIAQHWTIHQVDISLTALQFHGFFDAPMFASSSLFFAFGLVTTFLMAYQFKGQVMKAYIELVLKNVQQFEKNKCQLKVVSLKALENVLILWKN